MEGWGILGGFLIGGLCSLICGKTVGGSCAVVFCSLVLVLAGMAPSTVLLWKTCDWGDLLVAGF